MREKLRQRLRDAVKAIHSRGEYPSRTRLKIELSRTALSTEENEVRLATIRELGLEVAIARAGYRK